MNMLLPIYLIVVASICLAAIPLPRRDGGAQIVKETSRSLVSARWSSARLQALGKKERKGDAVMGALPLL
jgi:hypothetical protein